MSVGEVRPKSKFMVKWDTFKDYRTEVIHRIDPFIGRAETKRSGCWTQSAVVINQ